MMRAAEGVTVDDGGAEPRAGQGLGPAAEGFGHGRAVLLLALGQDLEQQLGCEKPRLRITARIDRLPRTSRRMAAYSAALDCRVIQAPSRWVTQSIPNRESLGCC
jgi:hypothetical protein